MDLRYTADEQKFRAELREWLADVLPGLGPEPDREDWNGRRAWDTRWQRMLFDAGYAGINWPKEFGGLGATPTEHLIFIEESERARAPYVGMNFVGLLHAGPTLIAEASAEQKAFHLPGILKGDHVWCQGFSEPNAGSDLASLRTRAVRDGDDYVISGQKIWTSYGHVADYCEMLVRTDTEVPKHKGITWLILDMHQPGVTVRPMRTIDGESHFCEVFLDEARVPVENRVGAANDGWRVANVTLRFERGTDFARPFEADMSGIAFTRDPAGWRVRLVNPDTPAEEAGLREGDLVTSVDGVPAAQIDPNAMRRAMQREGRSVRVGILRGTEASTVTLVLRRLL
jgi:alkylation response protein AidB-like acyl-CoA dehydrogenase